MRAPASLSLPLLICCLATLLVGCQVFRGEKKESAKPEEPAAVPPAGAEAAAATAEAAPPEAAASESAAAPEAPPPPPASSDSPEFAGLPKGETEFILACRNAAAADQAVVEGRKGYLFSGESLRETGANRTAQSTRHRMLVGTLAAYAARVRATGAEFVLVPMPPKEVVYPDRLPGASALKDGRYDTYLQKLYAELERGGVRVVDVTKELRGDRFDKDGAMFPKADFHWSPRACQAAANRVHKDLKRPAKSISRDKAITSSKATIKTAGETFRTSSVGLKEGKNVVPLPVPAAGTAPIVIVCDAAGLVYHQPGLPRDFKGEPRCGLPDQLAGVFGAPVEVRGEPGLRWKSASARFAPGSSGAVKLVVWCFPAVDFLEDGGMGAPAAAREVGSSRRATVRPVGSRRQPPAASEGLRLRDDPGVDVRPQ